MSRDAGVSYVHKELEDCQLLGLLLFLSLIVKSQNRLVHNSCQHRHLLYLLFFWYSPQFILKSNSNLGFEDLFFCSLLILQKYQNLLSLSNFGTLILERFLEH